MYVSVVIPVYNAERFLTEAIESALIQPEVQEILLAEDGSRDASLEICHTFQTRHPDRVSVFRHTGAANKGAGETRNLGMRHAHAEYIAFLDADDVYLPQRFTETMKAFQTHPDADGIYETVGTKQEEYGLPDDMIRRAGAERARLVCDDPDRLFQAIATAKHGYLHLNGLTIKRSALDSGLYFDPVLRQCQDTDFVLRWSVKKKLYGILPDRTVALRRVHDENRVFRIREALHYRYLCMRKCALNGFYGSRDRQANWQILNRMARATRIVRMARQMHLPVTPFRLFIIIAFLLSRPRLIAYLFGK